MFSPCYPLQVLYPLLHGSVDYTDRRERARPVRFATALLCPICACSRPLLALERTSGGFTGKRTASALAPEILSCASELSLSLLPRGVSRWICTKKGKQEEGGWWELRTLERGPANSTCLHVMFLHITSRLPRFFATLLLSCASPSVFLLSGSAQQHRQKNSLSLCLP